LPVEFVSVKRDLLYRQKRPTDTCLADTCVMTACAQAFDT